MSPNLKKIVEKRSNIKFNDFTVSLNKVTRGIFFMYSVWSPSLVQLSNLVDSLEKFPNITLWVFDIDMDKFVDFKEKNAVYSDGWGETFWIKSGMIGFELKKYNSKNIDILIHYNNQIS